MKFFKRLIYGKFYDYIIIIFTIISLFQINKVILEDQKSWAYIYEFFVSFIYFVHFNFLVIKKNLIFIFILRFIINQLMIHT